VKQDTYRLTQEGLSRSCVIDPTLALSQHGLLLVQQIAQIIEVWIGRELLHILDNASFYQQQPHLLIPDTLMTDHQLDRAYGSIQVTLWSLKEWEKFRLNTDLANLNLLWLGDNPKESLLPKGRHPELFWRWEAIAHALEQRGDHHSSENLPLMMAFRDTVALAATLGSAFILTHRSLEEIEKSYQPAICRALQQWKIPLHFLSGKDPLVMMERHVLRQLMIQTQTTKLLWTGLQLAVLHLVIPRVIIDTQTTPNDIWIEAKAYLYPI
jgi:hypothetical protein